MDDLLEALQAAERTNGINVFDHSPEELGLMITENYEDALEMLRFWCWAKRN